MSMNGFTILFSTPDGETSSNQEAYFQLDNAIDDANARAVESLEDNDDDGSYIEHNHPDVSNQNEEFCVSVVNQLGTVTDTWSVVKLEFKDTMPT